MMMKDRPEQTGGSTDNLHAPDRSDTDEDLTSTDNLPTAAAPSFPGFASTVIPSADPLVDFESGTRFDDFEIVREVGRGAGGGVYLARQLSLDRRVALKISAIIGDEARTMAQLEHPHIVQVYSETVDTSQNLRLVCMQYVEGTTLDAVISRLREQDHEPITGRTVLEAIRDAAGKTTERTRRTKANSQLAAATTPAEVTCLIGGQLAGALAYAHGRGILHRDIKPANVLMDTRGRPYLADFNLSSQSAGTEPENRSTLFGGTIPYMAPEHLDAFNPGEATAPESVDERSDVYSLGVVIHQLYTRRLPFPMSSASLTEEVLQELASQRRKTVVTLRDTDPDTPLPLEHVIQRCLAGDVGSRFQHVRDVQVALDGCRALMHIQQQIRPQDPVTRFLSRHPLGWVYLFGLLSQVLTVGLFVAFGMFRLLPKVDAVHQARFDLLFPVMALPLFLTFGVLVLREMLPMHRVWAAFERSATVDAQQVKSVRRRVARFPVRILWLTLIAWGIALTVTAVWCHHEFGELFSDGEYWLVGLISVALGTTCDVFGMQYLMLCLVYPWFWADASHLHGVAKRELRGARILTRVLQALAGTVPLAAVVLLLSIGPEELDESGTGVFRFLSITLVVVGMGLFQLSNLLARRILDTVNLMTTVPSRDTIRLP